VEQPRDVDALDELLGKFISRASFEA